MISDDEVESEAFADLLFCMIEDSALRERMRACAQAFETQDASTKLADAVERAASTNASADVPKRSAGER